ncbi:MAG: GNAT family N-acetyltransferase, partial [Candidatus Marinimicrobia bacterium]|nr:GNAT family N-acetyltransferase [Candidatus Neomarinimicrobiota bacterium]
MKYLTEPLNSTHDKENFSCGGDLLDNYFKKQAKQDVKRQLSACFVLSDKSKEKVKGYYTLSGNSISNTSIPASFKKRLSGSYASIPFILLGRLAVDKQFQGSGIGGLLLLDSLKRCLEISASIGAFAVIVDPLGDKAEAFYEKYGFIKLPDSGKM